MSASRAASTGSSSAFAGKRFLEGGNIDLHHLHHRLHGAPVAVRDIDILLAPAGARALLKRRGMRAEPGVPSALFRSDIFAAWEATPYRVELFAGFHVREGQAWRELVPETREVRAVNGVCLFLPAVPELIAWGRLFSRDKDRDREPLLAALLPH